MRHIHMQPADKIPRDEEVRFRERAKALVDKWHVILNASKDAGDAPDKANGVAPAPAALDAPQGSPDGKADTLKADEEMPAAPLNGAPVPAPAPAPAPADGDVSVLADVTMSEA